MFDEILRNATVPGAFMNAVTTAEERDLQERRRRGGYKVVEVRVKRSRLAIIRERLIAVASRRSHGAEDQMPSK